MRQSKKRLPNETHNRHRPNRDSWHVGVRPTSNPYGSGADGWEKNGGEKVTMFICQTAGGETLFVEGGTVDSDSNKRELLRYGCACKNDHGKTDCGRRFVSVEVQK